MYRELTRSSAVKGINWYSLFLLYVIVDESDETWLCHTVLQHRGSKPFYSIDKGSDNQFTVK